MPAEEKTSPRLKTKIRPSSAAANLQTHPDFKSGLYDNTRPTTASQTPGGATTQRPRTQATGPRFYSQRRDEADEKPPQRRLTIGHVDGIGEKRPGLGIRSQTTVGVGSLLKGKVIFIHDSSCSCKQWEISL